MKTLSRTATKADVKGITASLRDAHFHGYICLSFATERATEALSTWSGSCACHGKLQGVFSHWFHNQRPVEKLK